MEINVQEMKAGLTHQLQLSAQKIMGLRQQIADCEKAHEHLLGKYELVGELEQQECTKKKS